jgi:hypothetical protein
MVKAIQFSVEDLQTPVDLERVLRQFQAAISIAPTSPASPPVSLSDLAKQIAPLVGTQLQAGGGSPLNLTGLLPSGGSSALIEDTHANRLALNTPPKAANLAFFETDRKALYASGVVAGAIVWIYASGQYVSTFANRPADLGTNDNGFLFFATDQDSVWIWTGAAWDTITRRILFNGGSSIIFTAILSLDRTLTLPDATGNVPSLPTVATTETGSGAIVRTTSPTIATPTIADLTNMQHSHLNAAGGGVLDAAAIASGVLANARISASGTWVPTFANLTVVAGTGAATYTGLWWSLGPLVFIKWQISTSGTCTTASTSNLTSITNLPFTINAAGLFTFTVSDNNISNIGVGLFYTGTTAYTPTWAARGGSVTGSGWYAI